MTGQTDARLLHIALLRILCEQCPVCPGGVVVGALDLRLNRSRVPISAVPLSYNSLGQVVHTCASVTKQYNLVPVKGR